ncbi:MAG TPA: hypothetical protein VGJ37_12460 [Pyrinomonadaceae bacterium]|jgi:hypothetical protein
MADPQAPKLNPIETATRSPSGADLVLLLLLVLFGFGIWALVERGFTELLRSREPDEQKIMKAHGVTRQKAELTEVQNDIAETQKYLNAARLDQAKQYAAVQSYVFTYPELNNLKSPGNIPAETLNAFREATRLNHAALTVVQSLEERLAVLKLKANTLSSEVESHEESAQSEFRWSRGRYVVIRRVGTFVITLTIVMFLLWLARVVLWKLAHNRRMSTAEGFRPFVLALAALMVLFAYDQFGFAGAAFVGILLLLLLLRRINWAGRSDAFAK